MEAPDRVCWWWERLSQPDSDRDDGTLPPGARWTQQDWRRAKGLRCRGGDEQNTVFSATGQASKEKKSRMRDQEVPIKGHGPLPSFQASGRFQTQNPGGKREPGPQEANCNSRQVPGTPQDPVTEHRGGDMRKHLRTAGRRVPVDAGNLRPKASPNPPPFRVGGPTNAISARARPLTLGLHSQPAVISQSSERTSGVNLLDGRYHVLGHHHGRAQWKRL